MCKKNYQLVVQGSPLLEPGVIPCGVPYWDTARFFKAGGHFSEARGYHIGEDDYLPDFEDWLPRKWHYRGNPPVPVLLPDMLPTNTWENNLRTELSDAEWNRLRKFCYQAAGHTCIACGSRGEPHVEAHEAWAFDKTTGTQTLKGLLCFCPTCHKAKHLGFAKRLGKLEEVCARLKWLNTWDDTTLEVEIRKCEQRQIELSKTPWKLDLRFLRTYGVR